MTDHTEGKLEVRAIENGTVIDHIPSDCLFKIIKILDLEHDTHRITFGTNLESKRMGSKAIIKINDRFCKQDELNRIAIVAPMAKVNIIENFRVTEKRNVTIPETVRGFVRCVNPKCITNNEPVETSFTVIREGEQIALRCKYCEKITHRQQIEIEISRPAVSPENPARRKFRANVPLPVFRYPVRRYQPKRCAATSLPAMQYRKERTEQERSRIKETAFS